MRVAYAYADCFAFVGSGSERPVKTDHPHGSRAPRMTCWDDVHTAPSTAVNDKVRDDEDVRRLMRSDGSRRSVPPSTLYPRRRRCCNFSSRLKPIRSLRVMMPTTRLAMSTTVRCRRPRVRNTMYVRCSENSSAMCGADRLMNSSCNFTVDVTRRQPS